MSVVVAFYNEEPNVAFVLEELRSALPDAEIVAVDDGSTDDTWNQIQNVSGVVALRFPRNRGQSAAIYEGLQAATGELCALMDGDGQNDPSEFPKLAEALETNNADVVCGYRAHRKDTWKKRVASKIANAIRRSFLDDGVRDTGCAQKVFHRSAVNLLVPFDGLHRFLPALFKQAGLKIVEVPVNHRERRSGSSKYTNWKRAVRGIYDLFGVSWLLKRKIVRSQLEVIRNTR